MKKSTISVILGIVTAIVLGMLMLILQGYNPFQVYGAILSYSLLSSFGITNTLNRMSILLLTSASAALALRSGASNLGQFGQLLAGAMVSMIIGTTFDFPIVIMIPLCIVASMVVGALYANVATFFKFRFNMNEFITTLMLNFIADLLTEWMVAFPFLDPNSNWPMSRVVNDSAVLPSIGGLDTSFIMAIIISISVGVYTLKTRDGYENKIIGKNIIFAQYGGIVTKKQFVKTMTISGALAGLAGCLMIIGASQQHRFMPGIGRSFGDDGLMVAIVSGNSLPLTVLYSFVFSIMQSGSTGMQLDTGVPSEFTVMLIAITVLSVVAFRSYASIFFEKLEMKRNERELREVSRNESAN